MAQYDVTAKVHKAIAAGYTLEELQSVVHPGLAADDDRYIAWNRSAQRAIERFIGNLGETKDSATPAQVQYVQDLMQAKYDDAFFLHIPEDLNTLTKSGASTLIDALKKY